MAQQFHAEQWLPYPVEAVFAFFANPENLPRLMPAWQKARIEEATFAPPPLRPEGVRRFPGIAAGDGTVLTISARPFPLSLIRLPWVARIEEFRWNEGFCDVQERGPFVSWRHCHRVRSEQDPNTQQHGTVVCDDVEFVPPKGVPATILLAGMGYVFRYRQRRAAELLAAMAGRR